LKNWEGATCDLILCLVLHSLFCTFPLRWFISLLLSSDFYCIGVCFYSSAGACFSVYAGVLRTVSTVSLAQICASFRCGSFFCVAVVFLSTVGRTFCNVSYGMHRLDQLSALVVQMLDAAAALS